MKNIFTCIAIPTLGLPFEYKTNFHNLLYELKYEGLEFSIQYIKDDNRDNYKKLMFFYNNNEIILNHIGSQFFNEHVIDPIVFFYNIYGTVYVVYESGKNITMHKFNSLFNTNYSGIKCKKIIYDIDDIISY